MGNLKFKCPECKGTLIEEIMTNVTVTSRLTDIQPDGFAEYSSNDFGNGEVDRYQCSGCGFKIEDEELGLIYCIDDLYKVAVKKGWINNA
jgi:DNA-directed RNA polymerase subunit RPC12/RpoP